MFDELPGKAGRKQVSRARPRQVHGNCAVRAGQCASHDVAIAACLRDRRRTQGRTYPRSLSIEQAWFPDQQCRHRSSAAQRLRRDRRRARRDVRHVCRQRSGEVRRLGNGFRRDALGDGAPHRVSEGCRNGPAGDLEGIRQTRRTCAACVLHRPQSRRRIGDRCRFSGDDRAKGSSRRLYIWQPPNR